MVDVARHPSHVRDQAAWLVTLAEERRPGTYDAIGEAVRIEDLPRDGAADALARADLGGPGAPARSGVEPWAGRELLSAAAARR